jgi:ligand-binding SRPBCC domain-containing protein
VALVIRFELETTIERPPGDVFAVLADPLALPEWQGTSEVEQLTEGPVGEGTRFREVHRLLGLRLESITEVVGYEPDRRFEVRVVSGPVPIDGRWELRPDAVGTHLRFFAEGGGPGLAAPFLRRRFRRQHARLKRVVEGRDA